MWPRDNAWDRLSQQLLTALNLNGLVAVSNEQGESIVIKTPSTPDDPSVAITNGLQAVAARIEKDLNGFLVKELSKSGAFSGYLDDEDEAVPLAAVPSSKSS